MENKSYAAFLSKKFGFTICSDFIKLATGTPLADVGQQYSKKFWLFQKAGPHRFHLSNIL